MRWTRVTSLEFPLRLPQLPDVLQGGGLAALARAADGALAEAQGVAAGAQGPRHLHADIGTSDPKIGPKPKAAACA